jgi:hypothetical protein
MKSVKFTATLHNFRLAKENIILTLKVPAVELSEAIKNVMLLNKDIMIGINCEGNKKVVRHASVDKFSVDRDGESTLNFISPAEDLKIPVLFFSDCTKKPVAVVIKEEQDEDEEEEDDDE